MVIPFIPGDSGPADPVSTTLREFPGKTVLVLGDVILDEYIYGEVKRISPEAPVPVVEYGSQRPVPGGAANVAANIAALKARPLLAGVVGTDDAATRLRNALEALGVNASGVLAGGDGRPTTVKQRILAQNQQIVRLDREVRTPVSAAIEDGLLAWFERHLRESQICILSDYGKGVLTRRVARIAIEMCRRAGIPVLVDPKSLGLDVLQGATLVKPNKHEAERLANREIDDEASFHDAGNDLANRLDGTAILITRGAAGMSLFRRSTECYDVATAARNVYDVTGAGDTVISTLAVALAANATLEQAVWLAAQSAAIVVGKLGTSTVTLEELLDHCRVAPDANLPCTN